MNEMLTPVVQLLNSFEPVNGFLLAVTLHIVASWCCQAVTEVQRLATRIGIGVFLVLLLGSLLRDGYLYLLMTRIVQSGCVAWMTASTAKIVLPPVSAFNKTIFRRTRQSPSSASHRKQGGLRARQARIQEAHRRRREAEWEAGRESREAAAEEAARRAREEEERQRHEQTRREVARFNVKMTYDRHAAEIRLSLPRKRFDEYLTFDLSDDYPAEVVEQRAEQMAQTILDFFESNEPEIQNTPEAIDAHYEAELERVSQLGLDSESTTALRSELAFAWRRSKQTGKIGS